MKTVYLGLGSNLGDRAVNLARARELLGARLPIARASSLYETAPRDFPDQPWFLNQVVEVYGALFPRSLLMHTRMIEARMGRKRAVPKGPRLIDIDILLYGESTIHAEDLEIPHPRMAERRFVLEPLAELAPDLRHPLTKKTIREMLASVADQTVKRLS